MTRIHKHINMKYEMTKFHLNNYKNLHTVSSTNEQNKQFKAKQVVSNLSPHVLENFVAHHLPGESWRT